MSEPSGRPSRAPFASYDPTSYAWRTSTTSLDLANLPESSVTWPISGSMRNGEVFARAVPVHPTSGCASSSSPLLGTPRASDGMKHPLRENVGNPRGRLEDQIAKLFPTPTAWDWNRTNQPTNSQHLPGAISVLFPTPCARDWKGPGRGPDLPGAVAALLDGPTTCPVSETGETPSTGQHHTPSLWDHEEAAG